MSKKLTCVITIGDPAGIGPEVTIKALSQNKVSSRARFIVVGSAEVLEKTARKIHLSLPEEVPIVNTGGSGGLILGRASTLSGKLSLEYIQTALALIREKQADVLVTAPVNKQAINQALLESGQDRRSSGVLFSGHTEYLAESFQVRNFAMMLSAGRLRVVLVTRHIALKDVPGSLTRENIYQTLSLSAAALRESFGIRHPRIAVCALNPHAGEEGLLGSEEAEIILPAVKQAQGLADIQGPLPADTLFYLARQGKFDAVICMYHDQGLIPLKTFSFHKGVNITLGLPFTRTSPDHGTAYNISGRNQANPSSMIEAIKTGIEIGHRKNRLLLHCDIRKQ
ncbi:MAG: 4-hydroxythreonine-4-phosphate dehydrogenase PdxA [Candidatus Omnitrophota bacterium]